MNGFNKTYMAEVKAAGDRRYSFTISTTDVDRHVDRVLGWDLGPFAQNAVVLFAHDHTAPIARAEETTFDGERLRSTAAFPPPGVSATADTVAGLLDADVLRAASVGFLPREWQRNDDTGGFDFTLAELLEWSIVAVPANDRALSERAKSLGIDLAPLADVREREFLRCLAGRCDPVKPSDVDVERLVHQLSQPVLDVALRVVDDRFALRTGRLSDRRNTGSRLGGAR